MIVGNPPWSTGQRSSADENPNVDYPEIEARIAETYAKRSNRNPEEQPVRHVQDGHPLGLRPNRRAGCHRIRHERVVDRRQRGFRRTGMPRRGVHLDLRAESAGQPANAGRTIQTGRREDFRPRLPGAGRDYPPGAQPEGGGPALPHPLPRHRRLPDTRGEAEHPPRRRIDRRGHRLAGNHSEPSPRLDRAARRSVPEPPGSRVEGSQGWQN